MRRAYWFYYSLALILGLFPLNASALDAFDSEDWSSANRQTLQYEIEPGINLKSGIETEVRYKIVNAELLILFEAYDSNINEIRRRMQRRDSAYDDDSVGVLISPSGTNGGEAFIFWVSAAGVQMDSHWNEARQEENDSWNARWWSDVEDMPDGYRVKLRIPLSQLPLSGGNQQKWAIEFQRRMPRKANILNSSRMVDQN